MSVRSIERNAKSASSPKSGLFALLCGLLRRRGSGAPSAGGSDARSRAHRFALAIGLLVAVGALALSGTPASAAVIHEFKKELTGFSEPMALTVGSNGDLYVAGSRVPVDRLNADGEAADFSCGAVCKEYVSGNGSGNEITGTGATGIGTLTVFDNGTGTLSGEHGHGAVQAGSTVVTGVSAETGAFAVGQTIEGFGIPGGTTIETVEPVAHTITLSVAATGNGEATLLVAGSKEVTAVKTTTGAFAVGQEINGIGIQVGTTITAVGPGSSLTLSKVPMQSGSAALTVGSREITGVSRASGAFSAGQEITAPGLPAGTAILAVRAGGVLEVSNAATVSESAPLTAHQSLRSAKGVAVDDATGDIYVSTEEVVDVFSETGEYRFQLMGTCEAPGESAIEPGACPGSKLIPFGQGVWGLAVDQSALNLHSGDLYVANTSFGKEEVGVFSATGEYVSALGGGLLTAPFGMTVALDEFNEDVYVGRSRETGEGGAAVDVFSSTGALEAEWKGVGTKAKTFGRVVNVGIDPASGRVYVAASNTDDEVAEFEGSTASEEYLGGLPGTPKGSFAGEGPSAVAVDPGPPHNVFIGEHTGVVDEFGPDISVPGVKTEGATNVTPSSATLNGEVNNQGEPEPAVCTFFWGTTETLGEKARCEGPGSEGTPIPPGAENVPVHVDIARLAPDTRYYYHVEAASRNGTNTGDDGEEPTAECEGQPSVDACFTTSGPGLEGESASDIASTSATFDATLNPDNGPSSHVPGAVVSYFFQYGRTTSYEEPPVPTAPGASLGESEEGVEVEQHVQGLLAGTLYHYRVVAVSEGVEYPGVDQTFTTQVPGVFALPDSRQWEMVSPPQKEGALIEPYREGGGVRQAAVDGDAFTYATNVPTEPGVSGYDNLAQVLSTRGPDGWVTRDLSQPHVGGTGQSLESSGQEYRFFSEDLSRAVVQPFGAFAPCQSSEGVPQPCLSPEASEQTAFLRADFASGDVDEPCNASCYTPLVTQADDTASPFEPFGHTTGAPVVGEGSPCPPNLSCGPYADDATPDARHVVLNSLAALTAAPVVEAGGGVGVEGLYEWSAGLPASEQLQPLYMSPKSESGGGAGVRGEGDDLAADGSVFFSYGGHLYVHDPARDESYRLDVAQGVTEPVPNEGPASILYFAEDGSMVLFSDPRQLTSAAGGGVYECRVVQDACGELVLTDLAATGLPGGAVVGASEDGSYLYYATDCTRGGDAPDNSCKLYVAHRSEGVWTTRFITAGDEELDLGEGAKQAHAPVSPNGRYFAFMSGHDLTGYDTADARSGKPDQEVYEYDVQTGRLACASCDPSGARPMGVAWGIPLGGAGCNQNLPILEGEGRECRSWVSAVIPYGAGDDVFDDGRVFFDGEDALVPKDVNGTLDVYEYEPEGAGMGAAVCGPSATSGAEVFKPGGAFTAEGVPGEEGAGCVGLISSGDSAQESAYMEASRSGGDVFFMTTAQLAPQDFDNAYDVYDAHECTSVSPCIAPPPTSPPPCTTADACRAAQVPQPSIYGAPSSATFNGAGNVSPAPPAKSTTKALTRAQRLTAALKACRRDRSKTRRASCRAAARRRYGSAKQAKKSSRRKRSK